VGHRAVNVWRNTHLWVSLFERRPRCRAVAKLKWWPVSAQNATFTKNFFSNISLHWVCHDVLMTRMLRWFPVLREHALALRIYIFVLLEVRFVRLEACQCCSYNILFSLKTTANQRHFSLRQTGDLSRVVFLTSGVLSGDVVRIWKALVGRPCPGSVVELPARYPLSLWHTTVSGRNSHYKDSLSRRGCADNRRIRHIRSWWRSHQSVDWCKCVTAWTFASSKLYNSNLQPRLADLWPSCL